MLVRKARSFIWRNRQFYLPEHLCSRNGLVEAELFDAGFTHGDSCYNALHRSANGRIYFAIGSWRHDSAARLFCFDESTSGVSMIADFDSAVGEVPGATIPQGKVHVEFAEWGGRMYTATHIGFYNANERIELPGRLPGRAPYQGGFFLRFNPAVRSFTPLAKAPEEEGIIAMAADSAGGRLYGLSWPGGLFLMCDIERSEIRSFGPVFGQGERGAMRDGSWSPICRSLAADPRNGDVYWSDSSGRIFAFRRDSQKIELAADIALSFDGQPCMWRKVVWNSKESAFYGILSRSSRMFRFDPVTRRVEPLAVLRAEERHGEAWWHTSPPATLAFHLCEKDDTIRYLATGAGMILENGRRVRSTLSLLSYHIPSESTRYHGIVRLPDGRFPTFAQSLLLSNGFLYAVAWSELPADSPCQSVRALLEIRREVQTPQLHGAIEEVNLIRFPDPILEK
jgi:hypothetical protein